MCWKQLFQDTHEALKFDETLLNDEIKYPSPLEAKKLNDNYDITFVFGKKPLPEGITRWGIVIVEMFDEMRIGVTTFPTAILNNRYTYSLRQTTFTGYSDGRFTKGIYSKGIRVHERF